MFQNSNFNQPLAGWDTSSVTNMIGMFHRASNFNQPLTTWDTSGVTNMRLMFRDSEAFNQSLAQWDTSGVTDMRDMFNGAKAFDQIIDWDLSSVAHTSGMFTVKPLFENCGASRSLYEHNSMCCGYDKRERIIPPMYTSNSSEVIGTCHALKVNYKSVCPC